MVVGAAVVVGSAAGVCGVVASVGVTGVVSVPAPSLEPVAAVVDAVGPGARVVVGAVSSSLLHDPTNVTRASAAARASSLLEGPACVLSVSIVSIPPSPAKPSLPDAGAPDESPRRLGDRVRPHLRSRRGQGGPARPPRPDRRGDRADDQPARRHARALRRHRRARPRRRRADDPAVPAGQRVPRGRGGQPASTATRCSPRPRRPRTAASGCRRSSGWTTDERDVDAAATGVAARRPRRCAPGAPTCVEQHLAAIDAREAEIHAFNLVLADAGARRRRGDRRRGRRRRRPRPAGRRRRWR